MFMKSSQTTNNRDTMNIDQKAPEWGVSNVKDDNLILNMANFNFKDFCMHLFSDIVRIIISDGRINSGTAITAFARLILFGKYFLLPLILCRKNARDFQ